MNVKILKDIKKYAKLRGKKDGRLNEDTFRKAYEKASPETQEKYKREMQEYFKAIEDGKIEAGDPIFYTLLS